MQNTKESKALVKHEWKLYSNILIHPMYDVPKNKPSNICI